MSEPDGQMQNPSHERRPGDARTRRAPLTSQLLPSSEKSTWRIAVVDDDPSWLELACIGLTNRGYEVTTFERGQDLLDSPMLRAADLVVLDYHLPDMDGVTLCEAIHQLRPTVRTVLCTGNAQADVVVAALREGLNDYIVKPVPLDGLDACIRRLLDDDQRERQLRRRPRLHLDSGKMIPGTPYRLDGWIGEGGMGTVYRGTHVSIERRVALKVLHPEHCIREQSVRTFRNEARASARIGAPNIVDIIDFAELEDGRLLIAMEFLDGVPLDQLLRADEVGLARMLPIARQICRGLAAAHEAGIVHRDVKPANVMLVHHDGKADFVKLVDFGIAAFQSERAGSQPIAGTPHYMAPESIQFGTVDPRVDEYALGCLLYEWATGQPPFDGTTEEILHAHVERDPAPLESTRLAISDRFRQLILRCLSKHPDARFGSMAELEAALCEVQIEAGLRTAYDDLPLPQIEAARRQDLADRMPRSIRPPRKARRGRILAAIGGAALIALSGISWAHFGGPSAAEEQAENEIRDHVESARLAASRFYFVYPPVGDPDAPTAYSEIAALEDMHTVAGRAAAKELRHEFAETLVRLGDRYWDTENGQGFAREYYAMARLFLPEHGDAAERAALTPSMLAELRSRAAARDFVEGELAAMEPLVALAEDDPVARSEKLRKLQADPSQPSTVVHRIAKLEAEEGDSSKRAATERKRPAAERASGSLPASARDSLGRQRSAGSHLRQAERARRAGDLAAAEMHYNRAIDSDHNDLRALDGLAEMHYDAGDYGKSLRYARLAAKRGAPNGRRFIALGDAYYKVLRYSDALTAYERARSLGAVAAPQRIAKVRAKLGR